MPSFQKVLALLSPIGCCLISALGNLIYWLSNLTSIHLYWSLICVLKFDLLVQIVIFPPLSRNTHAHRQFHWEASKLNCDGVERYAQPLLWSVLTEPLQCHRLFHNTFRLGDTLHWCSCQNPRCTFCKNLDLNVSLAQALILWSINF